MKKLLLLTLLSAAVAQVNAATIQFDLRGTAGLGVLAGNEPSLVVPSTASGGEIGAGVFYDDAANLLTVNVGWGSAFGFTDLSSLANNSHIHGPTTSVNGNDGVGNFRQTAAVLFPLTRSSSAVSGGTFTTPPITLSDAQELDLLAGKYYINIHTANNTSGELRGFIVPVPEPTTWALFGLGAAGLLWGMRRRTA